MRRLKETLKLSFGVTLTFAPLRAGLTFVFLVRFVSNLRKEKKKPVWRDRESDVMLYKMSNGSVIRGGCHVFTPGPPWACRGIFGAACSAIRQIHAGFWLKASEGLKTCRAQRHLRILCSHFQGKKSFEGAWEQKVSYLCYRATVALHFISSFLYLLKLLSLFWAFLSWSPLIKGLEDLTQSQREIMMIVLQPAPLCLCPHSCKMKDNYLRVWWLLFVDVHFEEQDWFPCSLWLYMQVFLLPQLLSTEW